MKIIKNYWTIVVLVTFPLLRELSTNGTVDALIGLVVWALMLFLLLAGFVVFFVGAFTVNSPEDMKVDNIEKMTEPFKKMKWWKSAIHISIILGVYIYVDWTGPAVTYTIAMILMLTGVAMLRNGLNKIMELNGIVATVDPKDSLKGNMLE